MVTRSTPDKLLDSASGSDILEDEGPLGAGSSSSVLLPSATGRDVAACIRCLCQRAICGDPIRPGVSG